VRNPNRPAAFFAIALFAFSAGSSCSDFRQMANEPESAESAVRQQIERYAAALDAADPALAAQVWQTSGDVSFISPMGHAHGWKEVKQIYRFFGTSFSDRRLAIRDVSIHVHGDSAWAEFYWHFHAKSIADGSAVESDGRETQIYNRSRPRWQLVHVHYSGPAQTQ
jgi:ketosteroid isomerase-like protein